ncbi:MAG: GDYXXLXY domain-containing protein [Rickettsiales bacterium]
MTRTLRTKLVIGVVILQMVFFAGWYMSEAGAFDKPVATIMVKTVAYDPRDLLSGQYIRLNYEFTNGGGRWNSELKKMVNPDWAKNVKEILTYDARVDTDKQNIWVVLREVDGFYEPKTASFTKPENLADGEVVIMGHPDRWRIMYGIEKYFVPEGTKEPDRNDTTVRLKIYESGKVRIDQVFVKGKEWP